jgi:hypothetical protein
MVEEMSFQTPPSLLDGTCSATFTGTVAQATELYTNGVIKAALTDVSSGYMSDNRFVSQQKLVDYYNDNVVGSSYVTNVRPTGTDGLYSQTDLSTLQTNDKSLITKLKNEYCHHYTRYNYSLTQFLEELKKASVNADTAKNWLNASILLNKRLNAFVELVDYLAKSRIQYIQGSVGVVNSLNDELTNLQNALQTTYITLTNDNAIVTTQKEMIKYTLQKNNHISNQISLWATLNILAIATIFVVYRRM